MRLPVEIITRPLLTEKGTQMGDEDNKVVFEVAINANKIEIRHAVEKLYDVRVLSVRTQVVRGRLKRVGRSMGRCKNWKKAVVKLDGDASIDFFTAT